MKEEFWTVVCEQTPRLRILFAILLVLLLLTVFSVVYTTSGSPSHIIAVIDLILVIAALAVTVFMQWRCAKNRRQRGEWRTESGSE